MSKQKLLYLSLALNIILASFIITKKAISWTKEREYLKGQEHKKSRLEQLENLTVKPNSILLVGNSLTEGIIETLLGDSVYNFGISGNTSVDLLKRLDQITRHKPSKIFIEIGINDLKNGPPPEFLIFNYTKILDHIKRESPSSKIYIHSLLPVREPWNVKINTSVTKVNTELKKICIDQKIVFLDIYTSFIDSEGKIKNSLTKDGLHLNNKGYKIWYKILNKHIR